MNKTRSGFTIVELLIVIVVIAILAAISIVAYTGIQQRADTASRQSEMVAWARAFEAYKAANGGWPSALVLNHYMCLGTGFPIGSGGVPRCRDYNNASTGYLESNSTTLMSQIETIASVPNSTKKPVVSSIVGPYARTLANGTVYITHIFPASAGGCPNGTQQEFANASAYWCYIRLDP